MKFALLFVFLVSQFALSQSDSCRTAPFLSATRFNAAFQNNFNAPSADVEGSLAAGGSISVQSYTIGLLLRCNGGCCTPNTDNAIAGTSFNWNGGDLMTGNLVYGTTLTNSSWTLHCGTAIKRDSTSFFSTLVSDIQSTSSYLYSLPTTGTPEIKWSSFNMDLSAGRTLNVFKTTCADLVNSVSQYQIQSGTSAQTVIINVEGTGACSMKNSFLPNSGYWTKVIWNFVNATSLTIGSVNGSIIAPYADVSYSSGRLDGQLFAKSMSGGGQINWYQFSGCIPTPSTTGSTSTSGTTGSTSTSGTTGSTSTSGTTGSTSTSGSTGTTGADVCSQLVIAAPGCTCQNSGGKCSCQCPCC